MLPASSGLRSTTTSEGVLVRERPQHLLHLQSIGMRSSVLCRPNSRVGQLQAWLPWPQGFDLQVRLLRQVR